MTNVSFVKESLMFGWKTFKARPWLFVGSSLIYAAVQLVLGLVEARVPSFIYFLVNLGVGTVLALGLMSMYLKAHDNLSGASFKDMWNPKPFLPYLATSLLISVIVIVGLLALIVPGIILAIAFSMAPYLVIENRAWGFKALKESWRITKGHWLQLLLLGLVVGLLNIVGAFLLLVGLLVTAPVSILAMVHVYRMLSAKAVMPVVESVPVPPASPEA